MTCEIKKYPVQHLLLKNYIKFFWEIRVDHLQLNHKLIPQRNINLRFNLSDTPFYVCMDGKEHLQEDVFFSGLQDRFMNAQMKSYGKVDMLGICFFPEGFFPFLKIPVSEFKNQLLGADEVGFTLAGTIRERLQATTDTATRISILENELVLLLKETNQTLATFRRLFHTLKLNDNTQLISEFCRENNIGIRTLERMFNKYVGVSAKTYASLNRFQSSLNQLLYKDYSKLSDIAYDNDYFDQMHFIKDFKRFSGKTPKSFIHKNDSMLQVGRFT